MNNLEQLKKQYESGDYVCYVTDKHDSGWEVFQDYKKPELFVFGSEILIHRLIHKSHSHIADAVIANPSVEVEYISPDTYGAWLEAGNFFENYRLSGVNEEYRLKESKQEGKEDDKQDKPQTSYNNDGANNSISDNVRNNAIDNTIPITDS